jgi:hypothetical protein
VHLGYRVGSPGAGLRIRTVIENEEERSAWIEASKDMFHPGFRDVCKECDGYPYYLSLMGDEGHGADGLGTLQKFLNWKVPGCVVPSLEEVTLENVGDRRGHALFHKPSDNKLRSENQDYLEGTEYVDIPEEICSAADYLAAIGESCEGGEDCADSDICLGERCCHANIDPNCAACMDNGWCLTCADGMHWRDGACRPIIPDGGTGTEEAPDDAVEESPDEGTGTEESPDEEAPDEALEESPDEGTGTEESPDEDEDAEGASDEGAEGLSDEGSEEAGAARSYASNYELVKSGHRCTTGALDLQLHQAGSFHTPDECYHAIETQYNAYTPDEADQDADYFSLGTGANAGRCMAEYGTSASPDAGSEEEACPEGYTAGEWDYYKILSHDVSKFELIPPSTTEVESGDGPMVGAFGFSADKGAESSSESEMVEIGVGSCEEHASLQALRTETQPDLESCKAACKADDKCSYLSFKAPDSSCILFKGILCALDPADASAVTYGKPEWLHDHWAYYPARCEIGEDSLTFKLFDIYDCSSFDESGGTLPWNEIYSCEDLVSYSNMRFSYEGCGSTGTEEGCPSGNYPGGREYTTEDLKALLHHCPNACNICPTIPQGKGCKRSGDCEDGLQCIFAYDSIMVHRPICTTVENCQSTKAEHVGEGYPDEPCITVEERQAAALIAV